MKFPGLTDSQLDGIYKQMVCHIVYGNFPGAGPTWDFEAWHLTPSWATALSPSNECQKWGDTPGLGGEFFGKLIHSDELGRRSFLVDNQDGIYVRRHVLTTKAFACVKNSGHEDLTLQPLPQGFLDVYLPEGSPVTDAVCGPEPDDQAGGGGVSSGGGSAGNGGGGANPPPPSTYSETTGGETHTWTNYTNAGGYEGQVIPGQTTVQIACRIEGFKVANGNPWWYRIAQAPWSNQYYASADAFYNNGATSGSLTGTPWVDERVPHC